MTLRQFDAASDQGVPLQAVIEFCETYVPHTRAISLPDHNLRHLTTPCILLVNEGRHCIVLEAMQAAVPEVAQAAVPEAGE